MAKCNFKIMTEQVWLLLLIRMIAAKAIPMAMALQWEQPAIGKVFLPQALPGIIGEIFITRHIELDPPAKLTTSNRFNLTIRMFTISMTNKLILDKINIQHQIQTHENKKLFRHRHPFDGPDIRIPTGCFYPVLWYCEFY